MHPQPISVHEVEYFSTHEQKLVNKFEFWYFAVAKSIDLKKDEKEIDDFAWFDIDRVLTMKP